MSKTQWTKEQEAVLTTRNKNLLLSAAAGSGKTAVLVERIIRLITDKEHPVDVSELLVLTFTKAAASEMRSRITASLSSVLEDAEKKGDREASLRLSRQLSLMGSAHISTIDSFCQSLIKQYFYRIELDPKSRIMSDENTLYLLKQDVLSEVLGAWYRKNDPDFIRLSEMFGNRFQDKTLRGLIIYMDNFSRSMAFPEEFLKKLSIPYDIPEGKTLDDLPWTEDFLSQFRLLANSWMDSYRIMFHKMEPYPEEFSKYITALSDEYAQISLLPEASGWKEWQEKFASLSFTPRLPAIRTKDEAIKHIKEQVQDARSDIKKYCENELTPFFKIPEETWISQMKSMAPVIRTLSLVAIDFQKAFLRRKKEEGIMEFNDMEHYALELLIDREKEGFTPGRALDFPSETALDLRKKYREVMIDEYQDTNQVQETIAALISSGRNRFMVGDIKQSIYRFRLADPSIFREKYKAYKEDTTGESIRIDLNRNFRSDPSVLYGINFIFRQILSESCMELDYGKEEALYPGKPSSTNDESYIGGTIDIDLIEKKSASPDTEENDAVSEASEDMHRVEFEGRHIAKRIHEMMDKKMTVKNKDGTLRPLRFSDIAILMRSITGKAPLLVRTLQEAGIPAICEQQDDFLETVEVRFLWSLLQILDNPRQDLPMTAVLRSSLVGLTEPDLGMMTLLKKELELPVSPFLVDVMDMALEKLSPEKAQKLAGFRSLYKKWRNTARRDGVAPLLREILSDTDLLTYVSGFREGSYRKAHIMAFYNKALEWDANRTNGLYGFLDTIHQLSKANKGFLSPLASETDTDAVSIMTIHKSKGLEFPLVILLDSAGKFNEQDTRSSYILHKKMGLGLYYFDEKHMARWPTLYWLAVKQVSQEENLAEEARLLYVALTRARDKLIIVGTVKNIPSAVTKWTVPLQSKTVDERTGNTLLPPHLITGAQCYLDWIVPAAAGSRTLSDLWKLTDNLPVYEEDREGETAKFALHILSRADLLTEEELTAGESEKASEATLTSIRNFLNNSQPAPEWLEKRFSWSYSHKAATETPAKITATTATRLLTETEDDPASITLTENLPDPKIGNLPPDFVAPPSFLSEEPVSASGTSYGTLMHKAMQYLDFKTLSLTEDAVIKELTLLKEKHVFTEEEFKVLMMNTARRHPVRDFITFGKSALGQEMKNADQVYKELPFSILLPANKFYPSCEKDENIFLQGIIDCLLINGDKAHIIDYKTDHVKNEEELIHHYRIQLLIYGYAMEKITGRKVTGLSLWSFTLGREITIK